MFNAVTDQQIKIDKITELETFKNKENNVCFVKIWKLGSFHNHMEAP